MDFTYFSKLTKVCFSLAQDMPSTAQFGVVEAKDSAVPEPSNQFHPVYNFTNCFSFQYSTVFPSSMLLTKIVFHQIYLPKFNSMEPNP
jgi:hypothetical protein